MAKLRELVSGMAEALSLPQRSVNVVAIHLRRAGLISSGGRGKGGAEMSARDAATLLVGNMGAEQLKEAPEAVRDLGAYFLSGIEDKDNELIPFEPTDYYNIEVGETFLSSLTKIIQYYVDHETLTLGDMKDWGLFLNITIIPRKDLSFIEFYRKRRKDIRARFYSPGLYDDSEPTYFPTDEDFERLKIPKHFDLIKRVSITDSTIRNIARVLTNRPPAVWYGPDENRRNAT